ncbi:MAG TPA: hypothetical protein VKZ53_03135 [Candidatus Angelobacter sp.]|nr:hypothetical protein [Candidatus Angelobacter sp.]
MRTSILAALGLLLVEAFLISRTAKDYQVLQKLRIEALGKEGIPLTLSSFSGFEAGGRTVVLKTDNARWIVPFVVHASRRSQDLTYWERVKGSVGSDVSFVGFEDRASETKQASASFPVLAYGSYDPLTKIAHFDDRNEVLVLFGNLGVKQPLKITRSPEEMAHALKKAIAP